MKNEGDDDSSYHSAKENCLEEDKKGESKENHEDTVDKISLKTVSTAGALHSQTKYDIETAIKPLG